MNVATAAALLASYVDAGEGNLPFVVSATEDAPGYTFEEAVDIAPLTSPPPPGRRGTWKDEYDPGAPHTAIAAVSLPA